MLEVGFIGNVDQLRRTWGYCQQLLRPRAGAYHFQGKSANTAATFEIIALGNCIVAVSCPSEHQQGLWADLIALYIIKQEPTIHRLRSVCGLVVKSVVAIAVSTGPGFDSRRTHFLQFIWTVCLCETKLSIALNSGSMGGYYFM